MAPGLKDAGARASREESYREGLEAAALSVEAQDGMNPDWQKHIAATIRALKTTSAAAPE